MQRDKTSTLSFTAVWISQSVTKKGMRLLGAVKFSHFSM